MSEEGVERKLTTILAADVVGYSRLMEADEAGTLEWTGPMRSTGKSIAAVGEIAGAPPSEWSTGNYGSGQIGQSIAYARSKVTSLPQGNPPDFGFCVWTISSIRSPPPVRVISLGNNPAS